MVIIHKKHTESPEEKELRLKDEQEKAQGIQDAYQARGFELVSWVQDHKAYVIAIIAILFIGGAIFSGYLFYQQRSNEAATGAFLEAMKGIEHIDEEKPDAKEKEVKAQNDLLEVARNFPRSHVATLARLYAAQIAMNNNDAQLAQSTYDEALKAMKPEDPLYALASVGMAFSSEKKGDAQTALNYFDKIIASKDGIAKDLALYQGAILANTLNDKERSKKYITQLLEEFPASPYEKSAKLLKESLPQ